MDIVLLKCRFDQAIRAKTRTPETVGSMAGGARSRVLGGESSLDSRPGAGAVAIASLLYGNGGGVRETAA